MVVLKHYDILYFVDM